MSARPAPNDLAAERVRQLFEEHADAILRRARRRSPHLAEDVVSETFAVAVRRAEEIPVGRELPWLYVVADFTLQNMMRGQRRAARVVDALLPLTPVAADPASPPVIGDALGDLPERERAMLTMTAFEGLSAGEAADRIGITYGSGRNALVSGRRRLAVSLAALAAVAIVAVVVGRSVLVGSEGRGAPAVLKASIIRAGAIHQVALVHRGSRTGARRTRYDRWSDPSGTHQRVVLPGGRELTTTGGESLETAASRVDRSSARTPIPQGVREDLAALDVSSPASIAKLVAQPGATTTVDRELLVAGAPTTLVRGRVTGEGGVQHAVEAVIADGSPDVLRVRAQRLSAGRPIGAASTVDFVRWIPVPPGPKADAGLGVAPTTPAAGAASAAVGTSPATPVATPGAKRHEATTTATGAAQRRHHDAAPGAAVPVVSGHLPRHLAAEDVPPPSHYLAQPKAGPILHVRQSIVDCPTQATCAGAGTSELWVEQGSLHRLHEIRRAQADGPIVSETWSVGGTTWSYRVHATTPPTGRVVPMPWSNASQSMATWHGQWYQALTPILESFATDPARVAALSAGPPIDGRPSVVATAPIQFAVSTDAQLFLDPATRLPMQIVVQAGWQPPTGPYLVNSSATLHIDAIDFIRAGQQGGLLAGHFPPRILVRDYR